MREIHTDEVAASTSPLSQAIEDDSTIYVSGQVPRTPEGEMVTGDIQDQTTQVLENIEGILEAAGASMDDVVKTTVFLTDVSKFNEFNEAYGDYFDEPYPTRSAFGIAALAVEDIEVEIEAIAKK